MYRILYQDQLNVKDQFLNSTWMWAIWYFKLERNSVTETVPLPRQQFSNYAMTMKQLRSGFTSTAWKATWKHFNVQIKSSNRGKIFFVYPWKHNGAKCASGNIQTLLLIAGRARIIPIIFWPRAFVFYPKAVTPKEGSHLVLFVFFFLFLWMSRDVTFERTGALQ